MNRIITCLTVLVGFALLPVNASAYTVQPMVMEIATNGGQASNQFVISNRGNAQVLPISVQALRVDLGEDGSVSEVDASDEILLFPPTAIVPANGDQVIRVQFLGDSTMKTAQAYRVAIENVPVDLNKDESGVKFKTQFRALLFVVPPGASAQPTIGTISARDSEGYVTAKVNNAGNHYVTLSGGGMNLYNSEGEVLEMKGGEITRNVRGSIIFPHAERDVKIAVPEAFGAVERIEIYGY